MIFGKRFLTVLMLALVLVLPARAFAEMGIQLRVPYQASSGDANLKGGASGTGVLFNFGLDSETSVGLLTEQVNVLEGAAPVAGSYTVNAIRLTKENLVTGQPFFVAVDLGNAVSATKSVSLADLVFGGRIAGKKDKITSYLSVEMMYRFMNPGATMIAGGAATNYSGLFLTLGAGLTF